MFLSRGVIYHYQQFDHLLDKSLSLPVTRQVMSPFEIHCAVVVGSRHQQCAGVIRFAGTNW